MHPSTRDERRHRNCGCSHWFSSFGLRRRWRRRHRDWTALRPSAWISRRTLPDRDPHHAHLVHLRARRQAAVIADRQELVVFFHRRARRE